jgi:SRSO17 transposase
LVDGEWFLPEAWSEDRERCRAAGIPETMVYRPKTKVALQLYDRARAHGLSFGWLTFDEWYGSKPEFLRAPDRRGPRFVGEAQQHFMAWVQPPGGDHPTKTARPGHSLIRPPTAPMEVDFAR